MIVKVAMVLVLLYLLLGLVFYFFQHYIFFRPEILPGQFEYQYEFPFREVTFKMPDGGEVNAIHFEVPNAIGVVFYLKGNTRSIKGWGKFAKDFLGKGYDFFMMDYRGFGKSTGKRSEKVLYGDAGFVYDKLAEEYSEERIVLYGRSFGSGIAAWLAANRNPSRLILDSPYYTFRRQIARFIGWLPLGAMLKYKLPTISYIKQANCPVTIIHGDRDYLISYQQGVDLARESGAELITIKGGWHNNLPTIAQYHEELYRVLSHKG